jgi:hypothetical protein
VIYETYDGMSGKIHGDTNDIKPMRSENSSAESERPCEISILKNTSPGSGIIPKPIDHSQGKVLHFPLDMFSN